jgi:hypothetical protein
MMTRPGGRSGDARGRTPPVVLRRAPDPTRGDHHDAPLTSRSHSVSQTLVDCAERSEPEELRAMLNAVLPEFDR